jgi:hypothetical protein
MLELGGELDLAAEPLEVESRGQIRREHLDDDLPAEGGFLGQIDPTHAPAAQLAEEPVASAERVLEIVEQSGHLLLLRREHGVNRVREV